MYPDIPNLQKPRPDVWRERELYSFIEEGWNNALAVAHNKNVIAGRIAAIDAIFDEFRNAIKPNKSSQIVPGLLLMRSFSAYRASVMVSFPLPVDGFALQRSCLENSGYARFIADEYSRSELWLRRDDDDESRRRIRRTFTHGAIRSSIAIHDEKLASAYDALYDRTIDFGAHPNEKAITTSLIKDSLGTTMLQFNLLPGDGLALDNSLRTLAQVGICAVRILGTIFQDQYRGEGFDVRVAHHADGL